MEKSNQSTNNLSMQRESYETPSVEVIEVAVEKGFAVSFTGEDGLWS